MAKSNAQMKKLLEERSRMTAEIEALKQRLEGLNRAISLLQGEEPDMFGQQHGRTVRNVRVKETVLGLLTEHKGRGLTASETVELAKKRGQEFDRGSVSSLLSRLKREGVLTHDGAHYHVAERAKESPQNGSKEVLTDKKLAAE